MQLIPGLVRSYMTQQVAGGRDAIVGFTILALAVGILLLTIAFALLAAFWWLSDVLPQWQAALVIAGAALLLAIILRFIGMSCVRRRGRAGRTVVQRPQALASDVLATTKREIESADSLTLITLAVLAGIVVGRRLWK
ncbi:MAG: phage holin family protein [Rhodobiaceae bacterium]|nr:phage holin family protein [Rhodobiaceae bacterium]